MTNSKPLQTSGWADSSDLPLKDGDVHWGMYWAALDADERINCIIPMRIPPHINFEEFKDKARECLSVLGTVITGLIIERDGQRYFIKRLNHNKRGKSPRIPKIYEVYTPSKKIKME